MRSLESKLFKIDSELPEKEELSLFYESQNRSTLGQGE
ncbi:hypothetical protein STRDD13_00175 [Streptococcus sp. DD13]|nr:hypothetical protein STRDD13_00175 [Streptococcus sp. DD13]